MQWYRYASTWQTYPIGDMPQVGDWFITRVGGLFLLRRIQAAGIAHYGSFGSVEKAQGYAERQPAYVAS